MKEPTPWFVLGLRHFDLASGTKLPQLGQQAFALSPLDPGHGSVVEAGQALALFEAMARDGV
jgi:hypothetical protein